MISTVYSFDMYRSWCVELSALSSAVCTFSHTYDIWNRPPPLQPSPFLPNTLSLFLSQCPFISSCHRKQRPLPCKSTNWSRQQDEWKEATRIVHTKASCLIFSCSCLFISVSLLFNFLKNTKFAPLLLLFTHSCGFSSTSYISSSNVKSVN